MYLNIPQIIINTRDFEIYVFMSPPRKNLHIRICAGVWYIARHRDDLIVCFLVLLELSGGNELDFGLAQTVIEREPVVVLEQPRAVGLRVGDCDLLQEPTRMQVFAVVLEKKNKQTNHYSSQNKHLSIDLY